MSYYDELSLEALEDLRKTLAALLQERAVHAQSPQLQLDGHVKRLLDALRGDDQRREQALARVLALCEMGKVDPEDLYGVVSARIVERLEKEGQYPA